MSFSKVILVTYPDEFIINEAKGLVESLMNIKL